MDLSKMKVQIFKSQQNIFKISKKLLCGLIFLS